MNQTAFERLSELCRINAVSGAEQPVLDYLKPILDREGIAHYVNHTGNLIATIPSEIPNAPVILFSAHMDEVGFMISGIDPDGLLRFDNVGGIEPSVLLGRPIELRSDRGLISGTITGIPIHLIPKDQKQKITPQKELRIDIGCRSGEEASAIVKIGDTGTFRSDLRRFGSPAKLYGKAIDDRLGCAAILETLIQNKDRAFPFTICGSFTTREEIGYSGALHVAETLRPEFCFILESTAVSDLPGVPMEISVSDQGNGPTISFADRGTVYDEELFRFILETARANNIPAQPKRMTSGGNDANHVHTSGAGVRTAAISLPTRYIHSASCVIAESDYDSDIALIQAILDSLADSSLLSL